MTSPESPSATRASQYVHGSPVLRIRALHQECGLLAAYGHELGVCACTRWADAPSLREAALEAMRRYRQMHGMS